MAKAAEVEVARARLAAAPSDTRVLLSFVDALCEADRLDEACEVLTTALASHPTWDAGRLRVAQIHMRRRDPAAAVVQLLVLRSSRPQDETVLLELVDGYVALDDRAAALELLRQTDGPEAVTLRRLSRHLELSSVSEDPSEVARIAKAIVAREPSDARAWSRLAEAEHRLGHEPEALAAIDRALAASPVAADLVPLVGLRLVLSASALPEDVTRRIATLLERKAGAESVLQSAQVILAATRVRSEGRSVQRLEDLRRVDERSLDHHAAEVLVATCTACGRDASAAGDHVEASAWFDEAYRRAPSNDTAGDLAEARIADGDARLAEGDVDAALACFEAATGLGLDGAANDAIARAHGARAERWVQAKETGLALHALRAASSFALDPTDYVQRAAELSRGRSRKRWAVSLVAVGGVGIAAATYLFAHGTIEVRPEPPDASIVATVDGRPLEGRSIEGGRVYGPVAVWSDVKLDVSATGYDDRAVTRSAPFGRRVGRETIELTPRLGAVRLETKPIGAELSVRNARGAWTCTTPCTVERVFALPSEVRVSLDGYETYEATANVEQASALDLGIVRFVGGLEVISTPKGARVYLDGAYVGKTPFTTPDPIRAKPVRLELRARHYERTKLDVAVRPEQSTTVGPIEMVPRLERTGQVMLRKGKLWLGQPVRLDREGRRHANAYCVLLDLGPWQWTLPSETELRALEIALAASPSPSGVAKLEGWYHVQAAPDDFHGNFRGERTYIGGTIRRDGLTHTWCTADPDSLKRRRLYYRGVWSGSKGGSVWPIDPNHDWNATLDPKQCVDLVDRSWRFNTSKGAQAWGKLAFDRAEPLARVSGDVRMRYADHSSRRTVWVSASALQFDAAQCP
ncbi:MAG: PEGA domain-containing protein [Deltaproteobacteria bacterium]